MDNTKLISIIVPVYNVEKYLPQCIESIINQTYQDLEIILINDGSTDNCPQICNEYSERDDRIIVIHQKNGGAASARNAGLRIAKGDYLAFVDSDDYLELDAYERMMALMLSYEADIIHCAFRNVFPDKQVDRLSSYSEEVYTVQQYLSRYATDWMCALIWNKLYRRCLFSGIYFEEGHLIDDEFFTYQGVMNAERIVYAPIIVYNYRMRASSVMREKDSAERVLFDRLAYCTLRRERIADKFPELKQVFDYTYLDSLLCWAEDESVTISVILEIKRLIKEYFKKHDSCRMSLRFKGQLLLLWVGPKAYLIKKKNTLIPDENKYYD